MIRKRKSSDEEMVKPMQLQSSSSTSVHQPSPTTLKRLPIYLVAVATSLIILLLIMSRESSPPVEESSNASDMKVSSSTEGIVQDTVDGVDYYHCAAQQQQQQEQQPVVNLVLLHGAAFTKENWKSSGILDKLCAVVPKLSVTALDLNHRGNHKDLKHTLDGLRSQNVISNSKPVALVTPSASGFSMVDWISSGSVDELVSYVGKWIPVASPSIKSADESKLALLNNRLPILAIYGSRDKNGKVVSERLESISGAKLVEIEGGHPCYLDSPDDFIKKLLNFLK